MLASRTLALLLTHCPAATVQLPPLVTRLMAHDPFALPPLLRALRRWRACPGALEAVMLGGGMPNLIACLQRARRGDEERTHGERGEGAPASGAAGLAAAVVPGACCAPPVPPLTLPAPPQGPACY